MFAKAIRLLGFRNSKGRLKNLLAFWNKASVLLMELGSALVKKIYL